MKFPLEPRPGQLEAAEKLASLLRCGLRVVLSAPTGWGKTHVVIAALVNADLLPAVWLVRSLTLGRRVADDAAVWDLVTFTAAGRGKTCLLTKEVEDVYEFCRLYRYKCPFSKAPTPPIGVVNFEDLVKIGREGGWCPYYAQDLVEADIIVQNYRRRWRPVKAWVIDEAHNLLLPEEKVVTLEKLTELFATLRELGGSSSIQRSLEAFIRHVYTKDGPIRGSLYFSEENIEELRILHSDAVAKGKSLRPLMDLASGIAYVESGKVTVYRAQRIPPFRPAVFVSATLPPGAEGLLGEAAIRVPWRRIKATVINDVSSRYEDFDHSMALRYAKLLIRLSERYGRILVFAASERVAKELRWAVQYEEPPQFEWQGALLLRARGRYSEGVNIPADAVIVAGAPFLPPGVGEFLADQLRRAGIPDPARAALDIPMLTTTLQCIGRAWRDPANPPDVYLADWRYERYMAQLQEYFELEVSKSSI